MADSYFEKYSQYVISSIDSDRSERKVESVNNVIGVIKGKDNKKAVIISAHYDHLGYVNGRISDKLYDAVKGILKKIILDLGILL